jgi:hypothetical protein
MTFLPSPNILASFHVPSAATATLAPGFYRDSLRVVTAGGRVSTQQRGRIQAV